MSLQPSASPPRSRLLVVDDQPLNVQALYRLFADEHQVLMATGGEKALQVCREAHPDLVLLDLMMPGMDGYAVLERLKADPVTADIPVIFVTARDGAEDEAQGLALGAVDFIEKPINPEVVRQRVRLHLLLSCREAELRHLNEALEATVAQRTAALERSVRDLRTKTTVLDKAPFPILLLDPGAASGPVVTHANEAFHEALDHGVEDIVGHTPRVLFEQDNEASVLEALDQAFTGLAGFEADLWGRSLDGRRRRLHCLVFPTFEASGKLLSTVVMLSDITEVQQMQQERERLAAEIQESNKLQFLGLSIAGMAHDLNTPIGVGITAASQIRRVVQRLGATIQAGPAGPEELKSSIGKLEASAEILVRNLEKAGQLVQGFKKTSANATRTEWAMVNLAHLLESLVVTVSPLMKRARCRVALNCPPNLQLYTEAGSVSQAITNLLTNAALHAFEGREDRVVSLEARGDAASVQLVVADNGIGMSEEAAIRAFTPFFTTKRASGGSGLGLFSCRRVVVEVLGGSIRFESSPGGGTRFFITLPRQHASDLANEK